MAVNRLPPPLWRRIMAPSAPESSGDPSLTPFAARLCQAIQSKKSCVVVGLDPRPAQLPPEFRPAVGAPPEFVAERIRLFNRQVIQITAPHAVCVKPQIAFYEPLGAAGLGAYLDAVSFARENGLLSIGDIKRGDIGSTAEAYAQAHLGPNGADAVTVNPYLGSDSLAPFIQTAAATGRGLFILVKTSNPSACEIQDLLSGGQPVYAHVAQLVERLGAPHVCASGYSLAGAVVGATQKECAASLRRLMPHAFILAPGYGAQGATAQDCAACFHPNGLGAVVNSSRGITFAWEVEPWKSRFGPDRWREAIEAAVIDMKNNLEAVRRP